MTKQKIAKSNGLSLKTHSEIISMTADMIFKTIVSDQEVIDRFENTIKYSSLLHDIGKLTVKFQKFLLGNINKPSLKFRHNEIGWALLSKYLSYDFTNREIILNTVYWHHGISNQIGKHNDSEILNSIDEESINNMLEYLTECVGIENINGGDEYVDSVIAPLFYPKDSLPQLQICRSSVITADRIASNLNSTSEVSIDLVTSYFNCKDKIEITKTKFDGSPRFIIQKKIVNHSIGTTMVKATAGFGKTIIGVMWGFKNNKKTIWVVPRNAVANSLYISIIEECKNLGITPSIQKILASEIKETNDESIKMYEADIIITNIDNFLAPNFKNELMNSSSLIFGCNVIFDEFHELVTKAPLMALFIDIMRVRHKLTNAETLLLSATPIYCEYLWDTIGKKTNILPNKETHYPAVHDKKYHLKTTKEEQFVEPNSCSLVIKNTIASAQREKVNGDYCLLLHSDFTDEKKECDFKTLILGYNKHSINDSNKPNVIGTHIIQASLDISLDNLYEDVLSPESTMQRAGRGNRFGKNESANITITKLSNMSESSIKNILYTRNLSDSWFDYISNYNNQYLSLDELYIIYNNFHKENALSIRKYIESRYDKSSKELSSIYPIKFDNKKKNNNTKTAGSNKLRSSSNEVFYIVEHLNGESWVGPFSKQLLNGFDEEFHEPPNILRRMIKTMEKLRNSNDDRFEYNDIIDEKKYKTIDAVRRQSKKSNTPYIVYDRDYDDELGIKKII
jgi:CRISPR-associated endonuclease Cas3-HD